MDRARAGRLSAIGRGDEIRDSPCGSFQISAGVWCVRTYRGTPPWRAAPSRGQSKRSRASLVCIAVFVGCPPRTLRSPLMRHSIYGDNSGCPPWSSYRPSGRHFETGCTGSPEEPCGSLNTGEPVSGRSLILIPIGVCNDGLPAQLSGDPTRPLSSLVPISGGQWIASLD